MPKKNRTYSTSDEAADMLYELNERHQALTGQDNQSLVIELLIRDAYVSGKWLPPEKVQL